jgi:hypothetical protein
LPVTPSILQIKAKEIAQELLKRNPTNIKLKTFQGSAGFVETFMKRHRLVYKKEYGEAGGVDLSAVARGQTELQDLLKDYQLEDIYNADETGLFYRTVPDKTVVYAKDDAHGMKKKKDRVTILLCANADGTDKRKPLMIGKSKMPRCFKGKDMDKLDVTYHANVSAWMNCNIFEAWLTDFNDDLAKKKKKAVLLIDNAPVHGPATDMSNLKVIFLEPNTTSHIQPMDAGIIRTFKTYYRSIFLRHLVAKYDNAVKNNNEHAAADAASVNDIDMLMTSSWVADAWHQVTPEAIGNCWKKTNILPPTLSASIEIPSRSESRITSRIPFSAENELKELFTKLRIGIVPEERQLGANLFVDIDAFDPGYYNECKEANIQAIVDEIADFDFYRDGNQQDLNDDKRVETIQAIEKVTDFFTEASCVWTSKHELLGLLNQAKNIISSKVDKNNELH